jgi:O-antigen ligase
VHALGYAPPVRGRIDSYFVPAVVGFAFPLLAALTWAPNGFSPMQLAVRSIYAPVLAAEIFVIAVALRSGLFDAMRQWRWPVVPTGAAALLIVIALVTAALAPDPAPARVWTAVWLLHLMFGIAVAHLCRLEQLAPRTLAVFYLAGLFALMLLLCVFAAQGTGPRFDWTRHWPAATHIRHFGYLIAAAIALLIGLAAHVQRRSTLANLWLLALAAFAFALWTGSRGTVFGVAGGLALGLLILPGLRKPLLLAGVAASLALGFLIASTIPAPGPLMGTARTVSQTVQSGEVTTGRTQMWVQTVDAISKRPLFGFGEWQMRTVAPFADLSQPHNVILQVALAWGLVGLACVAILAFWFFRRSLPIVRVDADLAPPFLAVLTIAAFALIDNSLFNPPSVSIFAACAGMVASRWQAPPVPR